MKREFQTQKADYYLDYGIHSKPIKTNRPIEDFDAIVLESGNAYTSQDGYLRTYRQLLAYEEYKNLATANMRLDEPRPIFFTDVPYEEMLREIDPPGLSLFIDKVTDVGNLPFLLSGYTGFLLFLQGNPLGVLVSLPFISEFISALSTDKTGKFLGYLSLSRFFTPPAYRSAVTAHKIEEFIAPEIARRVHHKPYIFIGFGAGHNDLEPYLKHEKLRKIVRSFNEKIPSELRNLDKSYLNKIEEIRNFSFPEPSPEAEEKIIQRKKDTIFHQWEKILYQL